ncbi:MAG TPA: hypothetical protein VFN69_04455 [Rudaea sp.]|nr:hypothetical protein [Rudaea sp.]
MSALDKLRPEVQTAMRELRDALRVQGVGSHGPQFTIISAELRRLAAAEQRWKQWIKDGMRVDFLPPEPPK